MYLFSGFRSTSLICRLLLIALPFSFLPIVFSSRGRTPGPSLHSSPFRSVTSVNSVYFSAFIDSGMISFPLTMRCKFANFLLPPPRIFFPFFFLSVGGFLSFVVLRFSVGILAPPFFLDFFLALTRQYFSAPGSHFSADPSFSSFPLSS